MFWIIFSEIILDSPKVAKLIQSPHVPTLHLVFPSDTSYKTIVHYRWSKLYFNYTGFYMHWLCVYVYLSFYHVCVCMCNHYDQDIGLFIRTKKLVLPICSHTLPSGCLIPETIDLFPISKIMSFWESYMNRITLFEIGFFHSVPILSPLSFK